MAPWPRPSSTPRSAISGSECVLEYAQNLDKVVVEGLRAPLKAEKAELDEKIESGHRPRHEAERAARQELSSQKAKRFKADISFSELNREAERHVAKRKNDDPHLDEEY